MKFFTPVLLSFVGLTLASPKDCSRNNCNRAVGGTRIPGHLATASADCSRLLGSTTYQATFTVYSNITRTIGKRATSSVATVPKYATAGCDDFAEYSSACSCLGVIGTGATVGSTTITVTQTATFTPAGSGVGTGVGTGVGSGTSPGTISPTSIPQSSPSTTIPTGTGLSSSTTSKPSGSSSSSESQTSSPTQSTPSSSPTPCSSNLLTDPLNCGKCGNVCPSGTCSNGVCSSDICNAQACGGFTNCNPDNSECFCFSSTETTPNEETGLPENLGFCGQNAICGNLTPCSQTSDCNVPGSTGNVCAIDTCCGQEGVCLNGSCDNPAQKLVRMARRGGSARFQGTAAY